MIISNGSSAGEVLRDAGFTDDFMSWDDVLHEGPVPSGLSLDELSEIRARFISSRGWGPENEVSGRFRYRNDTFRDGVKSAGPDKEIVLWFEHDLYDQLQLIQILTEISTQKIDFEHVSLICHDRFISHSDAATLREDYAFRSPLSLKQLESAQFAWTRFTDTSPIRLVDVLELGQLSGLPFLSSAFRRWCEEYPDSKSGLSRTETAILECLEEAAQSGVELFRCQQATEEAAFLGDSSFSTTLKTLSEYPCPPIRLEEGDAEELRSSRFSLTDHGRRMLEGAEAIPYQLRKKWMGGVLLTPDNHWYWNRKSASFQQQRD